MRHRWSPAQGTQNIRTAGAFSINRARDQSNNFLLDGTDNNDPLVNQDGTLLPVEAIQEFKIQTSLSSADYGRTAGAQINVALKAGLFLPSQARSNFCATGIWMRSCGPTPGLDRSQYGASFRGPIRCDKAFFFIAYEGICGRPLLSKATVPSQNQIAAALSAVPRAGAILRIRRAQYIQRPMWARIWRHPISSLLPL